MGAQPSFDINDYSTQHVLKSLPELFTSLNLVPHHILMHPGFRQIHHQMDLCIDLSKEDEMAKGLARDEDMFGT